MLFELPTNTITEIFPLMKLSRNSVTIIQGQILLMKNETFSHIQIPTGNNHYVAIWTLFIIIPNSRIYILWGKRFRTFSFLAYLNTTMYIHNLITLENNKVLSKSTFKKYIIQVTNNHKNANKINFKTLLSIFLKHPIRSYIFQVYFLIYYLRNRIHKT